MTEDEYLAAQALTRYRAAYEILQTVITEHDEPERVEVMRGLHGLIEKGYEAIRPLEGS